MKVDTRENFQSQDAAGMLSLSVNIARGDLAASVRGMRPELGFCLPVIGPRQATSVFEFARGIVAVAHIVVLMALKEFVERCEVLAHSLCGDESCRRVLDEHWVEYERAEAARPFDASVEAHSVRQSMPDVSWSTGALLRTVCDQLEEPPLPGGLKRGITITSALARLAERGMPADAVVRTCIGPRIVRGLVLRVSAIWINIENGSIDIDAVADFKSLLAKLDADIRSNPDEHTTLPSVVATGMHGVLGQHLRDWIAEASITHILGWEFDDYLSVTISQQDRVLSAGRDATLWVFERFSKTYLDEWSRASLDWELVYNQDPELVAGAVGMSRQFLDERAIDSLSVVTTLKHRLTGAKQDPDSANLQALEVFEAAVALLQRRRNREALSVAQQAVDLDPNNAQMRQVLAFCMIPYQPGQAEELMAGLFIETALQQAVKEANLISVHLADGDLPTARLLAQDVSWSDLDEIVWLWKPESLMWGEPATVLLPLRDWFSEALLVLRQEK
jgi:hypothetical protein